MPDDVEYGETLTTNFMFLMRVETNLKLNLISHDGKRLIDTTDSFEVMKPEIHFL